MSTLFILGSTGLVGGQALALALSSERISCVIAPTRRALSPHVRLVNPRMDSILDSNDPENWRADGAICALGTTLKKAGSASAFRTVDHDLVLGLAARLKQGGVQRFVLLSSLGADPHARFLYPRTKGEVEQEIERLGFLSFTILRPGFLDGQRTEKRAMEDVMGRLLRFASPILPRSARLSSSSLVAERLVEAATLAPEGKHVIPSAALSER